MAIERQGTMSFDDLDGLSAQVAEIATYNVKNYGVVLDGITVNTVSLQSLLDLVETNGGGQIYFPEGICLTDTVFVGSNTELKGNNKNTSIVKLIDEPTGAMLDLSGVVGSYNRNITISNLHLKHIQSYTSPDEMKGSLILGDYCELVNVENCLFDNYSFTGVYVSHTGQSARYESWRIVGNTFIGGGTPNTDSGVFCNNVGEYCNISNNTFIETNRGVKCYNSANNRIVNNTIVGCGHGIRIWGYVNTINNGKILIANNVINHIGGTAIDVSLPDSTQIAIKGCMIVGNMIMLPYQAIKIVGGHGHLIEGNKVSMLNAVDEYLYLADGSGGSNVIDNTLITGNIFEDGVSNVASATGTNIDINNNIIY